MEAAYTLGASNTGVVRRVLIPGAAPGIAETLRDLARVQQRLAVGDHVADARGRAERRA